jgi:hypothetical protein
MSCGAAAISFPACLGRIYLGESELLHGGNQVNIVNMKWLLQNFGQADTLRTAKSVLRGQLFV